MTSAALEQLRAQLRDGDRDLLRALDARAKFPRHPLPDFPGEKNRGACPRPPIEEILFAISPPGTAADSAAVENANQALLEVLRAHQRLAGQIADAKFDLVRADAQTALETGDRDRMASLLADLPAELRRLDFIRAAAGLAPNLTAGLAPFLWREYLIPWTQQSEIAHLLEP